MLTADNITYKDRFSGLGFSLIPGALLAIYGADAQGLLMLLANKLAPTSGTITFEDQLIARNRDYKELTVYIDTTTKLRSWDSVEKAVTRLATKGGGAKELVEAALRFWGLEALRSARCNTLSAALRKRIILTQLLTLPRPIWLLDNPEIDLDAEGLATLDALMANRCNQDGIVIIATAREKFMEPLPALLMSDFA